MAPEGPILHTERLALRPPTMEDLGEYAPIFADPEVMRYIGDGSLRTPDRVAKSVARIRELFVTRGIGGFVLVERETGDILGDCFLVPIMRSGADPSDMTDRGPEIELGYRLKKDAWGKGFATEAAGAVLNWATGVGGPRLTEVVGVTHPDNEPSKRVLRKLGFDDAGETEAFYNMTTSLLVYRVERESR